MTRTAGQLAETIAPALAAKLPTSQKGAWNETTLRRAMIDAARGEGVVIDGPRTTAANALYALLTPRLREQGVRRAGWISTPAGDVETFFRP